MIFYNAARWLLRFLFFLLYRVRVTGAERVPAQGPAVVCANHTFYKDLILLGYRVPRKIRWFAKSELFKNPLFGALITYLGAFPVNRGAHDRDAIKTVYAVLDRGELLGIFPEGKRVLDARSRPAPHRSVVSFAQHARAPIVPVSVQYGPGPFGRGHLFSKIFVRYLDPVPPVEGHAPDQKEMNQIAAGIMDRIYAAME